MRIAPHPERDIISDDKGGVGPVWSRWFRDLIEVINQKFDNAASIAWSLITGKPTTLSGYGITDAYTKNETNNNFVNTVTSSISITDSADSSIEWKFQATAGNFYLRRFVNGVEDTEFEWGP